MKKKLKIPSTQLIQNSELTEFDREKEALSTELIDCKVKLLKLEEKERQWEKEVKFQKESEEDLKATLASKEKELQEKCEEVENPAIIPNVETDTTSLSNAMLHVKLKDVELTGLKQQNKNLEDMDLKKEE